MKIYKSTFIFFILFLISGCSVTKYIQKGNVVPEKFYYKTEFTTVKTILLLPVEINGISKNFVFDTGAAYSVIQRDSITGKSENYRGASKRKMKLGSEYVDSMKIGNITFKKTFAVNGDLKGLKEQIPNFGGLIGQPIISKTNWLIDYPNKKLEISNNNLSDDSFQTIKIKNKNGTPYTFISVNGHEYKVLVDFGSASSFNLPKESKLAKELLKHYDFKDNKRERYTLGGLQTITEKIGIVPLIKLGNLNFKNVETTINISSKPRIGISFFKDCIIYIDNMNGDYKIKYGK